MGDIKIRKIEEKDLRETGELIVRLKGSMQSTIPFLQSRTISKGM